MNGRHEGRRLPLGSVLAVLAAATLALAACGEGEDAEPQAGPPPPQVTVAKPLVRELVEEDEFAGRFEAVDEVDVRSRVGGYLDSIHFKDGAIVKAGDPLFTIDQRPFESALTLAQADLTMAETLSDYAEAQYKRAEDLSKSGNIPTATLDERRQQMLSARAGVVGAKATVERARLDLEYTQIPAPISGRIDRRWVSTGNLVQADATVLTTVVSLDPIYFYFDIDEREFLAYARDARSKGETMQEGAGSLEVTVRVADEDQAPFPGTLDFAENRIDAATGSLRVRAIVPNPEGILQPGLFGRVTVPGSLPYKAVLVPDEAIAADQDRRIVYAVDASGVATAIPVRLGPRVYGYRVVREGLTGEETIVIDGLMRVRPGMTVTPVLVELPPERT